MGSAKGHLDILLTGSSQLLIFKHMNPISIDIRYQFFKNDTENSYLINWTFKLNAALDLKLHFKIFFLQRLRCEIHVLFPF